MEEILTLPPGQHGFVMELHDNAGLPIMHRHAELEFNVITSGSAYYVVETRRVLVTAGTLIWLFPGQEHILVDYSENYTMWVGVFTDEVRSALVASPTRAELGRDDPGTVLSRQLAFHDYERVNELCRAVYATTGDPDRFNFGIAYLAVEAWHAYQHGRHLESGTDLSPIVASTVRLITRKGGCLKLSEAAEELNATPGWISRTFHREIGTAFTTYCNQVRLRRFEALRRRNPGLPLLQLAYGAGFGSYAQFYRVFTDMVGRCPSATRSE
jgi:AraC-like DNA-binding protein